ncbi:TruB family pseudouridylate synthase (N terminal domain) [Nesidiocoris tenuis]|uniref:TruB family pseudouridylate synthase (N terminal domain) n=1 Tax=Nesidiocoris tenuis TaxID=355587 RepID=A0ABN7AQ45_9HEMI|nr:TruB family pseudouridylate synthase (N terminal domain) [Nesidiocoris tenuis]
MAYKAIADAPVVWNLLNGVVCLYKSAGQSCKATKHSFFIKLASELNSMKVRPPYTYVDIDGPTTKQMDVIVRPSYADNPLVCGPRYSADDFKSFVTTPLGFNTSGVMILGVNKGTKKAFVIREQSPLRTYRLKCALGYETDNLFATGKVIGEVRYKHVKQHAMEKHLSIVQASHQRIAYESNGVDPASQEAYELAVRGLVRPRDSKIPIIYGAKLISFNPPDFTIELSCINEYEDYLFAQVHTLGHRLNSTATCTAIQCVHHSFFKLEDALLMKHWTLEEVVANIANNNRLLRKQGRLSDNLNRYAAKG